MGWQFFLIGVLSGTTLKGARYVQHIYEGCQENRKKDCFEEAEMKVPGKLQKLKYRWRRGAVCSSSEHIELTCGDKNIPVARVAPPVDQTFTVEILINEERAINLPNLKAARASLNSQLVERDEPEPWAYLKRHCSSSSNRFSLVLWTYYPDGKTL